MELCFAPGFDAEAALRGLKDVRDRGDREVLRKRPSAVAVSELRVPAVRVADTVWAAAAAGLVPKDVGSLAESHWEHEPGLRLVVAPAQEAELPAEPGIGTLVAGGSVVPELETPK
ncbi:hypothetical protein PG997_000442 [Apiospora hydei]|uniref:Uncharacterized protein n=1 Tax=Apiospora hydei TaxID=1337664 RepID=A0ABR1XAX4_9PEZI